jgi:uncharacterized membrane protein
MKFCVHCGAQIEDNAVFCSSCGQRVENGENNEYNQYQQDNTQQFNAEGYDYRDVEDNKVISFLSYLGILFIIPLIAAPNSYYAKFHANQGLLLFIMEMVCATICAIPIVGWIVGAIGEVLAVVFTIMGIVNALSGKAKELPIIGKYRIIK